MGSAIEPIIRLNYLLLQELESDVLPLYLGVEITCANSHFYSSRVSQLTREAKYQKNYLKLKIETFMLLAY
jgi:hypothetical protein